MSLGNIQDTDYQTAVSLIWQAMYFGSGAKLSDGDLKLILQVIQDAVDRLDTINTAVTDLRSEWDTQVAILQGLGAMDDATDEIDTADTAIDALIEDVEDAISVPTLVTNAVLSG